MAVTNPYPDGVPANYPQSGTIAQPAAGANFTINVPPGQTWMVQSVCATLATSATVANRNVGLTISDQAGNVVAVIPHTTNFTAGQTTRFSWMTTGSQGVAGWNFSIPSAQFVVGPGWSIASITNNIQSGDQWSAIALSYTVK